MANFSVGTVKSNKQMAAAYIAYMMVGSYFKDVQMDNVVLEEKLMMNYKLLSRKDQEEGEGKIDRMVQQMGETFLGKIEPLKCRLHLREVAGEKGRRFICLWFETGLEELVVIVDEKGNASVEKAFSLTERSWMKLKVVRKMPNKATASKESAGSEVADMGRLERKTA